ncbi:MAG: glycosyltransferase family 87 protein [Candidatus Limnocylindrales bacterium]
MTHRDPTQPSPNLSGGALRPQLARRITPDVVGVVLAAIGAVVLLGALVVFQGSRGSAYDFGAYDAAARRLAAGQPLYQAVTQRGPFAPGPGGIYLYAPPLAVLLLALVPLGAATAATAWQLLHAAALALACALLPVPRWVRLASFGIACVSLPTLLDLNLGNVSLFVLLAGAASWRWGARRGPPGTQAARGALGAGVLAALGIAVRPQAAILLVWWAWRRTPPAVTALLAAVGSGVVLVLGSAAVAGVGSWQAYVRLLENITGAGPASSDVGLASVATRAGLATPIPLALFVAGAVLGLVAIVVASRRDAEAGMVAAVLATLLLVPLLWPHYLVLLVLPAALLAARGRPWGLALPLLAWLPGPILPLVALGGCWAPMLAPALAASTSRGLDGEPEVGAAL